MEVLALRPCLHWSFSSVTRRGSSGPCVSEGSIQSDSTFLSLPLRDAQSTGPGGDRMAEPAQPNRRGASVLPTLTSVRTVLPLLVLLVFLYLGTLGAEPLHLFRRSGH